MSEKIVKTTEERKDLAEQVLSKIMGMEADRKIFFPKNYSPENAVASAFLAIQQTTDKNHKPALQVCTKASIADAVLDTVVQGLSPSKKQVYYIVRGNKLCADRSYFGTVSVVKRIPNVIGVFAQTIHKGDVIEYKMESGRKVVTKHEQVFENLDNEIIGAYATIVYKDSEGTIKESCEVMTRKEIDISWGRSASKTKDIHKDFPQEMAKRTALNRACKRFVNESDDSQLDFIVESFNRTDGRELLDRANAEEFVIEHNPEIYEQTEEPKQQTEEPVSEPAPTTENHELKF